MKRHAVLLIAFLALAAVISFAASSAAPDSQPAPIYGITIPEGFRDWRLLSVAHEEGNLNDLRAILGNDLAIDAYRKSTRPFPDGAIIARLAWQHTPSHQNNKAFGQIQSFVAGAPTNLQFMVKDSKRFPATHGWGFAQFDDGKPASEAKHQTCYACHVPAQNNDFLFTRYAP